MAGLLAPVTHSLGELCGTIGRYDEAVAYLERAIAECRRAELHSDAVRNAARLGARPRAAHAAGDRRRAAALGREALRRAQELRMPLLVADAVAFNSAPTGNR